MSTNRETAVQFLKTCALQSPRLAFERHAHPDFKHHNQYFAGDRDSLMNAMIEADRESPNRKFIPHQIFEDGDRVAVYSQVVKDAMEIAVVHILRFRDGKIAEMWDVGQVAEKDSPNRNGLF